MPTHCNRPAQLLTLLLVPVALVGCVGAPDSRLVNIDELSAAITVTPVLQDGGAVSADFGHEGGELTATGEDGTVYTLIVPPEALAWETTITMTPLAEVEGLPFGDGPTYGIDLEPSGLEFIEPAVLRIDPPTPIPVEQQLSFGYHDGDLTLAVLDPRNADLELQVAHFSGYGVRPGLLDDVDEVLDRIGRTEELRIEAAMQRALAEARQKSLSGQDASGEWERFKALMAEYEELVIKPRLAAIEESCSSGRSILRFLLGHERLQEIFFGEESGSLLDGLSTNFSELLEQVTGVCTAEEYQMCVDDHVVHRLLQFYLETARTNALLGQEVAEGESTPALEELRARTEDCMTFELEFTTGGAWGAEYAGTMAFSTNDLASFSSKVTFDASALEWKSDNATMTSDGVVTTVIDGSCTAAPTQYWSGDAKLLTMRWTVDWGAGMTVDVGSVTDITVDLQFPEGQLDIPSCSGGGVSSAGNDPYPAPYIYQLAHGDNSVRDWSIHAAEIWASAEWDESGAENLGAGVTWFWDENGTATLRHTPGK